MPRNCVIPSIEWTKLHFANNTIPVALGLVGNGMRVLPYPHGFVVVVNTDGNRVFARLKKAIKIEYMRDRQRILDAFNLLAINPYFSCDVRALEIEGVHRKFFCFRKNKSFLVPRLAHIMLVGSEEELEFHILARVAILLHVRIEKVTGIIQ